LDGKLTYYMKTITVSATHARNNFFELLGMVETGKQIIVKKDKKEVAIISPRKKKGTDLKGLQKAMDAVRGIWTEKDYQDWKKSPARKSARSVLLRRVGKEWLDGSS